MRIKPSKAELESLTEEQFKVYRMTAFVEGKTARALRKAFLFAQKVEPSGAPQVIFRNGEFVRVEE